MKLIALLLIFSLSVTAASLESLAGKTFAYPGPNCFGVAMYANDNISEIRGVDLKEFSAFITKQCVPVETPKRGDIGTFSNVADFIHAFIFLGEGFVLEKTGVDYVGKTPIHHREIGHTIYTFEASPECRRWGGGSRDCYNTLRYFRCARGPTHDHEAVRVLEDQIEKLFSDILAGQGTSEHFNQLQYLIDHYGELISESDELLLKARLESFKKQLLFF